MAEKLTSIECDGDGKDQLEDLLQKVETMRMKAQRKDIHNVLKPRQVHPTAGKKAHVVQGWEKEKVEILQIMKARQPGRTYVEISKVNMKVHKNCKICIHTKTSDPSVDFSVHFGIWTTGCPIFNKMDTKQRADVATALEIRHRLTQPRESQTRGR